ncbi:phenylacetaldoxime dehydratase family protein [Pseudonocardia spinosispora]|uniref:phenylacetaldoxime dehydratase family protein n=1 Tax=Pseudonocardia spinosispora TaxID=103441 RepID=UPI000416BB0D|nr:phenylacetaldoxime dehydratase family protein [Pseudonocardia spinosispora]
MESAIPGHLTVERTRHRRVPDEYVPPYEAFVARTEPHVEQVVMAYLGLQLRDRAASDTEALLRLDAAFAATDGPGHHDRSMRDDPAGYTEIVSIAYWDDPATFDRWFAEHREGWIGDDLLDSHVGRWIEVIRPTVHEFETIFNVPDRPEGVAAITKEWSEPIQEHAYWGGMRDRIPLSQTDAMPGVGTPVVERDGRRVRVRPQQGLCLIRSGQDWADTEGEDRELYLNDVEPVLRAGMDFLRDEGRPIGCYANRYLTVLSDGRPSDRSFGMSWWRSLDALERWSESHPTHVAIFGAAMKYLTTMGPSARLRLYHEVSVVDADEQYFEYLNCHENTGLLGAVE